MAAPAERMAALPEDSSSSDDEALRRCQEAVWEAEPDRNKDGDSGVRRSRRVVVADHEHDGNELQVTQGFRTHVARKLENFLDSCLAETETSSRMKTAKCDEGDDEGFRLFLSSVPGQAADPPPAPPRRRPVPSSSDSDSEMETRLKEAAVSISDLVPSAERPCSENSKREEEAESHVLKKKKKTKKKKKKKKRRGDEGDASGSPLPAQSNGEREPVRERKKKKRETNKDAVN